MSTRIRAGVWALVGDTPLVKLNAIAERGGAELCAKLESANPSGSVKDRPARSMILEGERSGALSAGATIVEATSGNTGISLAMLAAVRGHRCVLVMPEDMANARQTIVRAYGAEIVLTDAMLGMRGAVDEAERIVARTPKAWMARQFDNPANPQAHEETTAREVWEATEGQVDAIVVGVGTGGTITGLARGLRARGAKPHVVAVEPKASAVLSGGQPALHALQGLGAGFVPRVLDLDLVDEIIAVSDTDAMRMMARLAKEEGLHVGPSSGANAHAAATIASRMRPTERVVTILADTGERYQG